VEVSAKTGKNVEAAFALVISRISTFSASGGGGGGGASTAGSRGSTSGTDGGKKKGICTLL
jgi:hypothetical protein